MNSENVKELRGQIDIIDDQIIELVRQRIRLSNSIIKSKPPGQIIDNGREQEIHQRFNEGLATDSTPAKVKQLVQALLAASRLYP